MKGMVTHSSILKLKNLRTEVTVHGAEIMTQLSDQYFHFHYPPAISNLPLAYIFLSEPCNVNILIQERPFSFCKSTTFLQTSFLLWFLGSKAVCSFPRDSGGSSTLQSPDSEGDTWLLTAQQQTHILVAFSLWEISSFLHEFTNMSAQLPGRH